MMMPYGRSLWDKRNLLASFILISVAITSGISATVTSTSLSWAYIHWHRTNTGNFGFSSVCSASGSVSNLACNWNFSPPPSSDTHQMTLLFKAFHTPPGGEVVNDSPRTTVGTPMIIVKSVRLSSLWGLELICSATLQWFSSRRTLVWTRCSSRKRSEGECVGYGIIASTRNKFILRTYNGNWPQIIWTPVSHYREIVISTGYRNCKLVVRSGIVHVSGRSTCRTFGELLILLKRLDVPGRVSYLKRERGSLLHIRFYLNLKHTFNRTWRHFW